MHWAELSACHQAVTANAGWILDWDWPAAVTGPVHSVHPSVVCGKPFLGTESWLAASYHSYYHHRLLKTRDFSILARFITSFFFFLKEYVT